VKEVREEKEISFTAVQHFSLGLYYLENYEDSLAIVEFKRAVEIEPENSEFLTELAFTLSKVEKFDEAEEYAKRALECGSTDSDLYIILGNGAKERGKRKKAISYYKKALADTSNYYLVLNLAQLMREFDEMDEAIILLNALKNRYPFDLRVHTQLGDIYGRVERFDLAKKEFMNALGLDSLYYPAMLGLGILYEIESNADSALLFYKKASQLNPSNVNLMKRIVEFNLIKGMWNDAKEYALAVLHISPTENGVRKQLAYALFRLKEYDLSLEQYLLLSGLTPKDPIVYHFLGRIYYEKENYSNAESLLVKSHNMYPEYLPNLQYLYIINVKEMKKKGTKFYFEKLKESGLKPEEIYYYMGTTFFREKNFDSSKYYLMKSITENQGFPNPWYSLGFVYEKLGEIDSAEYSYRKVITLDSLNGNAYNALGYLFVEYSRKLDEAKKLIERALEIDSLNGYYIDSYGWLYYKRGDFIKAKELLLQATKYSEDPVIYDHLGDVYRELGDNTKSKMYWEKALELDPDNEKIKGKLKEKD
jgi:tetratricopeptide (TPR) repeat protein